ncbi:hypothetical protein Ciccas_003486 [Cichlidogyrus casuarinus]|uniref:Uncharacterized protein n=1 Tax=Cichlidogyrus casuarinus TaxID=1844966 RepID=A0ABD2QEE8_9PLAT
MIFAILVVIESRLKMPKPQVYAISCSKPGVYEFGYLLRAMLGQVQQNQQWFLVSSVPAFCADVVDLKKEMLFQSVAALGPMLQLGNPAYFIAEIHKYLVIFGLDSHSLHKKADSTRIPLSDLVSVLTSRFSTENGLSNPDVFNVWDYSSPQILTEAIMELEVDAKNLINFINEKRSSHFGF